ncbi:hypothetical protein EXIGLDRAFT_748908 [Exidia glandulosa HHB12029]|uniref:NYN domain-containing protein n=1 Tax=Exidia glandulosa HHB12029 TaxID=1314781 RepID=A0A165IW53_EXIGL|nr:hypothetical protein EXIGLDRAFT_748908 [Exidia glandulosa HHB12029]
MLSGSDQATTSTTSPPFSPFSSQWSAVGSEATSDEPADLGDFNTVFRALSILNTAASQPPLRVFPVPPPTSSVATNTSPSLPALSESEEIDDSDADQPSWKQRSMASTLSPSGQRSRAPPSLPSTPPPEQQLALDDDDEDDDEDAANDTEGELEGDDMLPSLGYLDSALGFIAEERARLAAQTQANGVNSDTVIPQARRKRRRRRRTPRQEGDDASPEYDTSTGDALSAPEPGSRRSMPHTPRSRRTAPRQPATAPPQTHVQAQPLLTPSPAVQRLRSLAHKLRALYPDDAAHITHVLREMQEPSEPGAFVEVRGPPATPADPVVHVIVDYSNILIGFINYIKRHPELHHRRSRDDKPRLSHEALALIFERGRPTAKRELAASKPLYQPMTTAYQLGFDVHLFQRVPHEDAEPASPTSPRKPRPHSHSSDSSDVPFSSRPRWREQGVDECLQLKMYQSVVGPDTPGTLVLATGDAAPSQFNAAGFPGSVRSALERGWRVELYAWESGLSGGWARSFGEHERFSVRGLEMFAEDLLAVDPPLTASA